jgi:hypothetical protein
MDDRKMDDRKMWDRKMWDRKMWDRKMWDRKMNEQGDLVGVGTLVSRRPPARSREVFPHTALTSGPE